MRERNIVFFFLREREIFPTNEAEKDLQQIFSADGLKTDIYKQKNSPMWKQDIKKQKILQMK